MAWSAEATVAAGEEVMGMGRLQRVRRREGQEGPGGNGRRGAAVICRFPAADSWAR
ncbi:hypothetical protein SANT12839_025790 [Streptomyces antimycoticus]|uniref:Uncharacterized protein n=1 Tax=Streptomyces antimycoticus TaxID=68175 RepID=A0A4D4K5S4_9ACTN|nr:hypothetical protein SANT12839_025790 [Streptomyces antimycoticus]